MEGFDERSQSSFRPWAFIRDRAEEQVLRGLASMADYEIRPGNTVSFISEVDLTEIEQIRDRTTGERKPSYTAFVVKAVALALRDYPYANRRAWRSPWLPLMGTRLQRFRHYDVAVAVERDFSDNASAMFMDIVREADRTNLVEITDRLHALATCDVTTNKQWHNFHTIITRYPHWLSTLLLRLPCYFPDLWVKYRGGAAMVSSPAKYGVDVIAGSWPHPLGVSFGLVKPRPVAHQGMVVVRPTFSLSLNFDRAVMAGSQAAQFFRRIVEVLEHAESEMAPYCSPLVEAPSHPHAPT